MALLSYEGVGTFLTAGGAFEVREGDRPVATIAVEPGGFLRGPTWTWEGAFGPEWTLHAVSGDRRYSVARVDGSAVGTFQRGFASSRMVLRAVDGTEVAVQARRLFERAQLVDLPGDDVVVTRETPTFTLSSREVWTLEVPDEVVEPMRTLLLALPVALDHRRRRQERAAASAGGS